MTAIELNQVAAAVDDIAPEIYNADKKEVLAKAATFLRQFGEALELERKPDWEKSVKQHADFLDGLAVSGLFEVVSSSKFKAASILLNEMWQCFTHKANMLGLNHRIMELEELITRCLKTGSIRVDEHLDLWDDIHARLKLHQGEPQPEPMTAHQKLKEAQGRIKELEAENAQLATKIKCAELPTSAHIQDIYELTSARATIEQLESDLKLAREATAIWSHAYQESSAQNTQLRQDRDHLDEQHRSLLAAKNAMQAERDDAVKCLHENFKGVVAIRCMKHFRVPPYNRNECMGGECPVCEIERLSDQSRATIAALGARLEFAKMLMESGQVIQFEGIEHRAINEETIVAFLASTALKIEGGKA